MSVPPALPALPRAPLQALMEQWSIVCKPSLRTMDASAGMSSVCEFYKQLAVCLRALYAFVRVLPAYKVRRGRCFCGGNAWGSGVCASRPPPPVFLSFRGMFLSGAEPAVLSPPPSPLLLSCIRRRWFQAAWSLWQAAIPFSRTAC